MAMSRAFKAALLSAALLPGAVAAAHAQAAPEAASSAMFEIYGFAQGDAIVDFKQNDPLQYDGLRPSFLPAFPNEFGQDGHFYLSPRQTRFGVNTSAADVTAAFEFDLTGVGPNAGQTTFRLRQAWGQWKHVGAGQTWSQFVDVDVYPRRLEYWGPNGMPTFRNVQVFVELYRDGDSNLRIAIENPGGSVDGGTEADRLELRNINARFPAPDVTGHYRAATRWGHVQIGGALRYLAFDDVAPNDHLDLNGHVWGWGSTLSSNIKVRANNVLRLQVVYGAGIENYVNDAPIDVGIQRNDGNARTPIVAKALPMLSLVASALPPHCRPRCLNSMGSLRGQFRMGARSGLLTD